ncbi:MAG: hypothetical protein ACE5L6_01505 [Candidatus Bathyarchaeia archaeon]
MSSHEVYIRGKFDDLEDVVKLARAQAKKIFNLKGNVKVKEIKETQSGYLVNVVFEGSGALGVESMRKETS